MRAKTINEIRRGGDALRTMGAGKDRVLSTISVIRREMPSILTSVTMDRSLTQYALDTDIKDDVEQYTSELRGAIDGSMGDYLMVKLDGLPVNGARNFMYGRIITDNSEPRTVFSESYWRQNEDLTTVERVGGRTVLYYPSEDVVTVSMWEIKTNGKYVGLDTAYVRYK